MKIGRKSNKYEVSGKSNQVRGSYIGVKSQWSLWSPTLQYPLQPTTDQRNMAVTNDSCKWDACHWKSTCATPTPFQIKHPRKHGGCRGWNHIFGTFLGVFNMKWGWDYPFVSIIIYIMCIYIYISPTIADIVVDCYIPHQYTFRTPASPASCLLGSQTEAEDQSQSLQFSRCGAKAGHIFVVCKGKVKPVLQYWYV